MQRVTFRVLASLVFLMAVSSRPVHAQWGYPGGFGAFGWDGWGFGADTVQGATARGLGEFAAAEGLYNKQTAIADAIDVETVIRWNQFVYESQLEANRRRAQRIDRNRNRVIQSAEARRERLRNNPEPRDILQGDALNVALDELNDPRIYTKALEGAKARIGSDLIRAIPFRYASAAISVGFHQLATGSLPRSLATADFAAEREALRSLDQQLVEQTDEGSPDPATVKKLLETIYAAEAKVAKLYADPAQRRQRQEAEAYLKSLHGMIVMLKTPAIESILAGVEKRPEITLGQLLNFMNAFNLRFGVASTPAQQAAYEAIFPKLRSLRDQLAPALAQAQPLKPLDHPAENFFSRMRFEDLEKSAPNPGGQR
ncbi:MAG: hypothetical protein U0794_16995 [Isosphaeraceae bacterium]